MANEDTKRPGPGLSGDWIGLLFFVAVIINAFLFRSLPVLVIQSILVLLVIIFLAVSRIARAGLDDPRQKRLPPPAGFWRAFHFHVPPLSDTPGQTTRRLNITIVHDALPSPEGKPLPPEQEANNKKSLQDANDVAAQHKESDFQITFATVNPATTKQQEILPKEMESADAVYFLWTNPTRQNPVIGNALDAWSRIKTEVPILIVNSDNIQYDLHFRSMAPKDTGPAQLLFHTVSRTGLWMRLAAQLYRWWMLASAACLIGLIAISIMGIKLIKANEKLEAYAYVDDTKFNQDATNLFSTVRRPLDNHVTPSILLNESLDRLAKSAVDDIGRSNETTSTASDHISVFRKIDGKEILIQVIGPIPPSKFYVADTSIAGCAVKTTSFVLWEKGCKEGEPAAWNSRGKQIGSCVEKDNTIRLDSEHHFEQCSFERRKDLLNIEGVLCFSPAVQISENINRGDTAVCLTTTGNTSFLNDPSVRSKLRMFSMAANSLPTSTLITPEQKAIALHDLQLNQTTH